MNDLEMMPALGLFALGVALLVVGGEALVKGAITLAARLGVAPVVIGLTAVAFGTSAPELGLNLVAASNGHTELSFGNIVGSNIANIGLILGLSSLLKPMRVRASLVRREIPLMIGATALFITLGYAPPAAGPGAPGLSRADGVALLACFVGVFWLMVKFSRDDGPGELAPAPTPSEPKKKGRPTPTPTAIGLFLLGLALLVAGGKLAEVGAVGIAAGLGMSDEVIGLTVVALATSLPELTTSLVAARRGHVDLAVGNVVGSNLFNLLLVMGATSVVAPVPLPPMATGSFVILGTLSLLIWPMSLTAGRAISRLEGAILLAIYFGYLGYAVVAALGVS